MPAHGCPSLGHAADDAAKTPVTALAPEARDDEAMESIVRALLRRWGVIFWKLIALEADWLPPWRDLLMCCRRLEARGEIRGGRFVAGFSGEQYACLLYTSPSPRDRTRSRMPSSA